jgi:phosphotransferase system IIA component
MGVPGQLFTFTELKSRTAKQGDKLKRDAVNRISAAASKDIARVIIVTRKAAPQTARKRRKKGARRA